MTSRIQGETKLRSRGVMNPISDACRRTALKLLVLSALACVEMSTGCSSSSSSNKESVASSQNAVLLPRASWAPWLTSYDASFADVNGDGKADIVGIGPNGDVIAALSTGTSFAPGTLWFPNCPWEHYLADVNG